MANAEAVSDQGPDGVGALDMTISEIARVLNGERSGAKADARVTGVAVDSRVAKPGDVFFALVAERDGHEFVADAARAGVAAAVVSKDVEVDLPLVLVPDTLKALGDLARAHRLKHAASVVAVTGSVGKTTTKEMIAAVLGPKYTVLKSEANFNNEIGLPMTLFQLSKSHSVVVLEMAMRGPGEIGWLADVARPRIGVITNVGLSHIERLGSAEGIAVAKAELLEYLPPDGLAVLNVDDGAFGFLRDKCPCRVVAFGESPSADVRATNVRVLPDGRAAGVVVTPKGAAELELAALGRHNIWNALAAIAVALEMGVALEEAKAALEALNPPAMRSNVVKSPSGYVVVNDAYNAGPASMAGALRTLGAMQGGRRIAVLGDMLELGDQADAAHLDIGRIVAAEGIDELITVGRLGRRIADGAVEHGLSPARIRSSDNSSEVAADLKGQLRPGDIVLVKGSRAVKMEIVVEGLLGE